MRQRVKGWDREGGGVHIEKRDEATMFYDSSQEYNVYEPWSMQLQQVPFESI